MTSQLRDWRTLGPQDVARLWAAESARWRARFAWDLTPSLALLDRARLDGDVAGRALVDASGRVSGWTCWVPQAGSLQLAMLGADDGAATARLLDAALGSPDAATCDLAAFSVPDDAPGLQAAAGARGFEVGRYRYLAWNSRAIDISLASTGRTWRAGDVMGLIRLCARGYQESPILRPFAPHDAWDEWAGYVTGLLAGPGCGAFVPERSFVIDDVGGRLAAAVLTTDLGCGSDHLAQVVVDPDHRGRGLATALVRQALAAAADAGRARVTLLVSESNEPACRLYGRLGFGTRAGFLVGVNRQPRRLSSRAVATGGARTRR